MVQTKREKTHNLVSYEDVVLITPYQRFPSVTSITSITTTSEGFGRTIQRRLSFDMIYILEFYTYVCFINTIFNPIRCIFASEHFLPEQFLPELFSLEHFLTEHCSPEYFLPEQFLPEHFPPETFLHKVLLIFWQKKSCYGKNCHRSKMTHLRNDNLQISFVFISRIRSIKVFLLDPHDTQMST